MSDYFFNVEGMMCSHCSSRLERLLSAVDGVEAVQISLTEKTAKIKARKGLQIVLRQAIEDAGFEVAE